LNNWAENLASASWFEDFVFVSWGTMLSIILKQSGVAAAAARSSTNRQQQRGGGGGVSAVRARPQKNYRKTVAAEEIETPLLWQRG